jgi:hypothetical protein
MSLDDEQLKRLNRAWTRGGLAPMHRCPRCAGLTSVTDCRYHVRCGHERWCRPCQETLGLPEWRARLRQAVVMAYALLMLAGLCVAAAVLVAFALLGGPWWG